MVSILFNIVYDADHVRIPADKQIYPTSLIITQAPATISGMGGLPTTIKREKKETRPRPDCFTIRNPCGSRNRIIGTKTSKEEDE